MFDMNKHGWVFGVIIGLLLLILVELNPDYKEKISNIFIYGLIISFAVLILRSVYVGTKEGYEELRNDIKFHYENRRWFSIIGVLFRPIWALFAWFWFLLVVYLIWNYWDFALRIIFRI